MKEVVELTEYIYCFTCQKELGMSDVRVEYIICSYCAKKVPIRLSDMQKVVLENQT